MKKGQMEVVGLLVIVIFLLVIGLLVLHFSIQPKSTTAADSRSSLESTRLLQALVLTTIQGKSFEEHVVACSQTTSACNDLRLQLDSIFSVILKKGELYSFYLVYEDQNILQIEQCPLGVISSYPFVASGGFYEAKLRLCTVLSYLFF